MQSNSLYKTPINSRRNWLNKSNSLTNIFPKYLSKRVYKIRERLFSHNTLSLLSSSKHDSNFNSNYNNFKTNYTSMIKNLITNDVDLNKEKKSGIKSLDNLFTNINYLKNLAKQKNFFEQKKLEEKKEINKYRESNIISLRKKQKAKDNLLIGKKLFFSEKKNKNKNNILYEKMNEMLDEKNNNNLPLLEEKKEDGILNLKLVNQILKFEKDSKKIDNYAKDIFPMKLDKNYDEFIQKKIKLNYNPNFNSPNIHRMSVNFMINKNTKNIIRRNNLMKTRKKSQAQKLKEQKKKINEELLEEMEDKVEEINLEFDSIKKTVKSFLTDETKLNQITEIKEDFFNNYENRINFLYDCRRFPLIKNNLVKIKIEIRTAKNYEWNYLNMLGNCSLIYLNKLKIKLQREMDEIQAKGKEKEQKFRLYQDIGKFNEKKKKNKKQIKKEFQEDNNTSIDYIINIMKNEIKLKKEESEESDDSEKSKKEDIYNLEEFFINKSRPYKKIDFANEKLSYIVFNNMDFYRSNSRKLSGQKSGTKRKSMINVYT